MLAVAVEGQPVALSLADKAACKVVSGVPRPHPCRPWAWSCGCSCKRCATCRGPGAERARGHREGTWAGAGDGGQVPSEVWGFVERGPVHLPGLLQVTSLHCWGSC